MWALLACGCSHYISRGSDLYHQGRYIDAAHVFQNSEERLESAPQDERAQYALYRGATLLRLGDLPGAERWLGYAQASQAALDRGERALLIESLAAFELEARRPLAADALGRLSPAVLTPRGRRAFAD